MEIMRKGILVFILAGILGCFSTIGCVPHNQESTANKFEETGPKSPNTPLHHINGSIRQKIGNPHSYILINSEKIRASSSLPALYQERNYRPLWVDENGPLPHAYEMIEVIKDSYREGLNPNNYNLTEIDYVLSKIKSEQNSGGLSNPATLAEFDLLLTNSFLTYANHLLYGQVTPAQINLELIFGERRIDLAEMLVFAVNENTVKDSLNNLLPAYPVYGRLRTALEHYRKLAAEGGWKPVPVGPKMKKGSRGTRVAALKERLIVTGDLDGIYLESDAFDSTLDQAVRKYQERNGLYVDGVVGTSTLEALNVPVEERVRQIELSMERWRLLPQNMGNRFILVNIANFHLYGVENNRDALTLRIVVGKPRWNTPIFSEYMTHIVVNPYWNIPPSIVRDDIAPRIKSDPNYMANRNIQAVGLKMEHPEDADEIVIETAKEEYLSKVLSGNYRLRQRPGPSNPLGRIKFLFPNKYSVYLHDTPNRGYFLRAQRNFSHGCIRVENPVSLAEFVLSPDSTWNDEKIRSTINRGKTRTIHLPEPVPVYILYFTAWVDNNGSVNFHKDIYGLDQVLQNALLKSKARRADVAANIQEWNTGQSPAYPSH